MNLKMGKSNTAKINLSSDYRSWLTDLKAKIRSTQLKAAIAVNSALIEFYWELGKHIAEKETVWGSKFLETLSSDLQKEFPEMKGFSVSNLKTCKLFYNYFSSQLVNQNKPISSQPVNQLESNEISIHPQLGDEIQNQIHPQAGDEIENKQNLHQLSLVYRLPWGHIKLIISKIKDKQEANFYILQTIEHNWSRDTLANQIKSNLYSRAGKSVSNFKNTLPLPMSELAEQTLKDPYVFDFMTMSAPFKERDIENQLTKHIRQFLLELGKGFAFVGQQYHLEIAENDYYIDLLFYHIKLKCYVVIELKNTKFIPEYAGKLNFYLSAVDSLLKDDTDKPTIGILLCRDKNNIEAEFALRDINKPMGISEFQLIENLPENLRSNLPTIEEIENELNNEINND